MLVSTSSYTLETLNYQCQSKIVTRRGEGKKTNKKRENHLGTKPRVPLICRCDNIIYPQLGARGSRNRSPRLTTGEGSDLNIVKWGKHTVSIRIVALLVQKKPKRKYNSPRAGEMGRFHSITDRIYSGS